jgi:hypothetical protein
MRGCSIDEIRPSCIAHKRKMDVGGGFSQPTPDGAKDSHFTAVLWGKVDAIRFQMVSKT